ncbi:MAG: hypothetical protein AB7F89_06705 [Pirellulaceae bacterium]
MKDYKNSPGSTLLLGLCGLQAATAIAAAIGAFLATESIIGFCPVIACLGLVLSFVSLRRTSLNLLLFGLTSPVITSLISLLIAAFHWSPSEATLAVRVLMTLNAVLAVIGGASTAWQITQSVRVATPSGVSRFRFSVRRLLGVVTIAGLFFGLLRQLMENGEMMLFTVYGICVLMLSLTVSVWYWYRTKLDGGQGEDPRSTGAATPTRPAP